MFEFDPAGRLRGLVTSGDLRFVYVIGVARSNSTIVCRLLGQTLDGAVYEPATPAARDRARHYAATILGAYDAVRRRIGRGRPVTLAIKDLSLFLDDRAFDFAAAHAVHLVFTVREPAAAHASLMQQFRHEFRPLQRVDAVLRQPFEAYWMAWYFLVYGRRFLALGRDSAAGEAVPLHRLAMAGWSIESWRLMARQFAALGAAPERASVLDATEMRRTPERAKAALAAIAARLGAPPGAAPVEVAGHSRMRRRSSWAAEALGSAGIKPLAQSPNPVPALGDFELGLMQRLTPIHRDILASPANPLRAVAAP
jgi:hypothetical protein